MLGLALDVKFARGKALAACMHVASAFLRASLEGSRYNEGLLCLELFFALKENFCRGILCCVFCQDYRHVFVDETWQRLWFAGGIRPVCADLYDLIELFNSEMKA